MNQEFMIQHGSYSLTITEITSPFPRRSKCSSFLIIGKCNETLSDVLLNAALFMWIKCELLHLYINIRYMK